MKTLMAALVLGSVLIAGCEGARPSYQSTVNWDVGSDTLTGEAYNHTGQGCSHFRVEVKLKDHNDAVIRTESFDIGEVRSTDEKPWDHKMTALGFIPSKVPDSTTSVGVYAWCGDEH